MSSLRASSPGSGPMDDQLLAGVIMKLGGMAVAMIAFGVSFYRWYRASERSREAS